MRETDFNLHWSSTHYSGGHYHIKTVAAKNWITRNASPEKSWLLLRIKEELNMTPVEMTLDDSWAVWCRDDGGGMWSYDRAVMLCPTSFSDTGGQPAMRYPGGRANISRVEAASHAISRWQYEHQQPDHWSHHKTAAGENMASGMWNVWTVSIIYLVVLCSSAGWEPSGGGGVDIDTYTYTYSFASDWDILSLVSDSLNTAGTLNITTTPLS